MDGNMLEIVAVDAGDPAVSALLEALTAELALGGYAAEQTFGYSAEQLRERGVHLVGARLDGRLVGVGGVEVQADGVGELKRFFVAPQQRGTGVAAAVLQALVQYAASCGVRLLRLETGDQQAAARRFYGRHGFVEVPRFPPYEQSGTSVCMQRPVA